MDTRFLSFIFSILKHEITALAISGNPRFRLFQRSENQKLYKLARKCMRIVFFYLERHRTDNHSGTLRWLEPPFNWKLWTNVVKDLEEGSLNLSRTKWILSFRHLDASEYLDGKVASDHFKAGSDKGWPTDIGLSIVVQSAAGRMLLQLQFRRDMKSAILETRYSCFSEGKEVIMRLYALVSSCKNEI